MTTVAYILLSLRIVEHILAAKHYGPSMLPGMEKRLRNAWKRENS